ncbi:hypothetical protein A2884_02430 [Candidatus Saccharibacteria bacterium RIFCSPHIGHO2_01_FULL_48_12]|nr:MAG: hypothetical protein A2884_02430 [Candidatus Saccharibacteria bacterium RIFCSPHIGHO2_01_FULL_48_12]OGL34763.1 MAG: hypothetical protein A3F38_00940 [Candidatus Saccharibacteria bacterium RIFCSPHIGHO2_12_FULL_48_21]
MSRFSIKLRYANWLLIFLIVVINGYIIVSPLLPQLDLWRRKQQTQAVAGLPYKTETDQAKNDDRKEVPADNRLVIPKIALDQHIYQGTSPWLLHKGVWARPNTSTPPKGGNTVLTGHRFTYDGPATFYSLDKLAKGDKVVVYWQGKEFNYTVTETKVVAPTAVEIEKATASDQLTLYTCTPLWSAKNRLVVVAKLDEKGAL